MAQLYRAVKEKRKKEKVRKWKGENLKLMLCGVRIPSSILLQVLSPADIDSVTFAWRSRHNAHRNKPHVASQASLSSVHVNVVLPVLLPLHFVLAQACLPLDSLLPLSLLCPCQKGLCWLNPRLFCQLLYPTVQLLGGICWEPGRPKQGRSQDTFSFFLSLNTSCLKRSLSSLACQLLNYRCKQCSASNSLYWNTKTSFYFPRWTLTQLLN